MAITSDRNDPGLQDIKPDGMQASYLVLPEKTRVEFVRPVRHTYIHGKCGTATTMNEAIAETYAKDPKFYGATYCVSCGFHYPVGESGDFVWADTDIKVGT